MATQEKELERTIETQKTRKSKKKKKLLYVDVWQREFGQISVRAVFEIYARMFEVEKEDMRKYSFTHCVNALRKLEDPDYVHFKLKR